jgi:hypothetical protein
MNAREKLTAILLGMGLILALIPLSSNRSFIVSPPKVLETVLDRNTFPEQSIDDSSEDTVQYRW